MKIKRERHTTVDALRVFAIIAVVAIHTSTRTIEAVNGSIDTLPFAFLFNQLSRFAVPLFFMISGYVLELTYPFHQNYFRYLKKRFNKIFLPYVMWSAFYYLCIYREHGVNFVDALVGGNASYQLYFIPTLLIFYIVFPFLHELYGLLSKRIVFISLLLVQMILLSRDYYVHPLPLFYPVDIALLNYAFFIAGMVASRNQTKLYSFARSKLSIIVISLAVSAYFVCSEARSMYLSTKNYLDYYSSWRPSIFVYTFSFALFFYVLLEKTKRFSFVFHTLSNLSFFVFFIHVAILELCWNSMGRSIFIAMNTPIEEFIFLVMFLGVVTSISYGIAYVAHKIPYLSRITG